MHPRSNEAAALISRRRLLELSTLATLAAVAERPTRAWGGGSASEAGAVRVSRDVFAHHAEPSWQ